jgi:hypothetical protein
METSMVGIVSASEEMQSLELLSNTYLGGTEVRQPDSTCDLMLNMLCFSWVRELVRTIIG